MLDIRYIIPLHKKDERVIKAINSVIECVVYVVCGDSEIFEWMKTKILPGEAVLLNANSKSKSYPELVNFGYASMSGTPDYISILEFDDQLTPNSGKILKEYLQDFQDADIVAPLACICKEGDGSDNLPILLGMSNEVCFAPNMVDEYGQYDFNLMLRSNFMFVNGCYIKPRCFEEWGKFKTTFKVFYDYEWALRMIYNGAIVRGVPKATHFHYLSDDGAFETNKKLDKKIVEKWLSAVRREYFFEEERPLKIE